MLKKHLLLLFLAVVNLAALTYGNESTCPAGESEIPVEGAVYHVLTSDGSHKTYLDIAIGPSFMGKLPDDIAHIAVTGPEGQLPIGREDFSYHPQGRAFWIALPGLPAKTATVSLPTSRKSIEPSRYPM